MITGFWKDSHQLKNKSICIWLDNSIFPNEFYPQELTFCLTSNAISWHYHQFTRGVATLKANSLKKKKKILRSTYQQFPAKTDLSEVPWNQSPVSGLMVSIFINCLSAMGRGTQTLNLQVTLPQNCKNTKWQKKIQNNLDQPDAWKPERYSS